MKNLFLYYLKKRIPILLIAIIAFAILTIVFLYQSTFIRYVRTQDNTIIETPGDNPFIYLTAIFSIITTVVPIFEFSFKMKRRSIDLFYSLPIKRVKLYIVKYLVGLVEIYSICVIQWLISYIYLLGIENVFDLSFYFVFGASAICFILCLYTILVFFFTMGNNLIDGIVNMAMAACALPCVIHLLYLIIGKFNNGFDMYQLYMRYYFIYTPMLDTAMKLYYNMCGNYFDFDFYKIHVLALCINVALSVLAGILFILIHYKKNKAENVSDESDSFFGYRVFIPMYMVTGFCLLNTWTLYFLIAMVGYLAYAIYRKSFKLKRRDLFALGISILFGLFFGLIL